MQSIRLATNRVEPTEVRETDDAFIIEDVPFHKPKENLDGGYTPRQNVEQTAEGWAGVPATLFHVRNSRGKPVAAHNDPDKHIGEVQNPSFDGEFVRAETIRIEKDALDELGDRADNLREALENEEPIEVSSTYASADLPPGEYDGEFRTNAAAIVRPDSVAILPEGTGRCSIEDGCGINPELAANANVTVPMTDDPVDGEDMGSDTSPNAFERIGRQVANTLGLGSIASQTTGAESPADDQTQSMTDDNDKIEYIVANSDFDRENVEQWEGEQCLDRLYEQVKANADDDDDDSTESDNDGQTLADMTVDDLADGLQERGFLTEADAEKVVANRQTEQKKAEIASTIVANSAEYDDTEDVLEDFPTVTALENKRDSVSDSGGVPGTGVSASFEPEGDDDLTEDVTAGVFE